MRLWLCLVIVACGPTGTSNRGDNGHLSGGSGGSSGGGYGGYGAQGGGNNEFGDAGSGCRFVDILFLIDNSPSMSPKQQKLATAFPAFVDAIYDRLPPGTDVHVGITTTSFYQGSTSEGTSNCMSTATPDYIASRYIRPQDGNDGENGGQGRLYQSAGMSYFATNTMSDRQPLKSWFTTAATAVGEASSAVEFPTAGIAYTAHPANAQANAGFFRDRGAVLAVVALTDEPDKSMEPLATYHDMLASAKAQCGGDPCIVTAGIIPDCLMPTNNILWQFLNDFGEQTLWTSIDGTAQQYASVVGDALARVVSTVCMSIPTPG
jgi:hypothetical protein